LLATFWQREKTSKKIQTPLPESEQVSFTLDRVICTFVSEHPNG
jgi:hypothetical protein